MRTLGTPRKMDRNSLYSGVSAARLRPTLLLWAHGGRPCPPNPNPNPNSAKNLPLTLTVPVAHW